MKIRVYEMVGAEVFLCFEYEGTNMTARVAPKTAARTGDIVKFALDADKIHVFDKDTEKTDHILKVRLCWIVLFQ